MDWGALHDASFFLFLVNIDYDAKPKDFFTQEIWEGLSERTSSTTLRSLNHVEGKLVHHLELQKDPSRLDHQFDQQRDPTSSPHPQHESSYNLLNQWDPGEKSLLPQLFRKATASKIIYFLWIQSEYNLSCMLSKLGISEDSPSDPKIAYPLGTHPFDIKVSTIGKNMEKRLKKPHVIQINGLLTENAQKGSLVDCQEDVSYTALTIVCTINVSIDCDCFDVSNPSTRKNIHKRKSTQ